MLMMIQVKKCKVQTNLTNQEALQYAQGTYSSANNETKVVSRRITPNAENPQLKRGNLLQYQRKKAIAAYHRPDTSSKTCHALRNPIRIANSARRRHYKQMFVDQFMNAERVSKFSSLYLIQKDSDSSVTKCDANSIE
jgi:hypothetical protein